MAMTRTFNTFLCLVCVGSFFVSCETAPSRINQNLRLWLTISARNTSLEVSWSGARINSEDLVLITDHEPLEFLKIPEMDIGMNIMTQILSDGFEEGESGSGDDTFIVPVQKPSEENLNYRNNWLCNNGSIAIKTVIIPREINGTITTTINFDYALSRNVTVDTKCYGFWASYIDRNGIIIAKNCIQAHPKWMNVMKSAIADFRIRDIFIPGTHDSGSYRVGFDPALKETLVTKYSLTQDDDIRGQLMHGARYIDLRIGFYRATDDKFFVNHGISRQRPLKEVLDQIIDFVMETNEIVIVDIQEFPIGFGRNLDVHRFLVHFLKSKLEDLLVDPTLSWQITLRDIWRRKRNVILSYDHPAVVSEFSTVLFSSVQQRWGDVRNLPDLEGFLKRMNERDTMRLSSRPVADMAEITPDTWGVITDKYGGLRKLADKVNHRISTLYMNELGPNANIVAVDFMRGTSVVEAALYWNSKKVVVF